MHVVETDIPGCVRVIPYQQCDARGRFVKTFQLSAFRNLGLAADFVERYYSTSARNVLRGMHFQIPPHSHHKLVYCVTGGILDVVVDLRVGSPAYGRHQVFSLVGTQPSLIYIPAGVAHGFYTTSDVAVVMYEVTSEYSPEHDAGVRWDTIGMSWPCEDPILSERDGHLPSMRDCESPFVYNPTLERWGG